MFMSGSVDDHFAKSLGSAAWTRIKSSLSATQPCDRSSLQSVDDDIRQAPLCQHAVTLASRGCSTQSARDTSPCGSVDEHFAKALGEAWFRIKAEHKVPTTADTH